ncbi:hypothetical protein [Tardiphaga sp. vice278]|uniref:hypothetical protein n=1 Tax=Tardiphaga sp. vice278 TaxID=2592815 RepID=UPI0011643E4D|nr:hypothetical protein [Tardiphaga sp. vice278]QDM18186.1 hypothetical protein FNL53_21295 [Tardiphaga sp. vice278]
MPNTKLRRFFETLPRGERTDRVAYVTSIAKMPDAADGCDWKEDTSFNAAEAILQNPNLKTLYSTAIKDGCAVTDPA